MDPEDLREDIRAALDIRLVSSPGLEARVLAALDDAPAARRGHVPSLQRNVGLIALLATIVGAGSLALWGRALPHAPAGPIQPAASVQVAQFASSGSGWVVVSRFTGRVPEFTATVDRTDDAGAHWREQLRLDGYQPGLRADPDGRHAVAWISHPRIIPCPTPSGSRGTPHPGTCSLGSELQVFQTTDAGDHWTAVTPLPAAEIGYFLDTRHGWLLVPPGAGDHQYAVSRTEDGGHTWVRMGDAASPQVVGRGTMAFTDPETGWLALGTHAAPGRTDLLVTRDGGRTWSEVTVPPSDVGVTWQRAAGPPSLTGGSGVLLLVAHRDQPPASAARMAAGTDSIDTVLLTTTTDGGRTWSAPRQAPSSGLSSADFFLDARHWWLAGTSGSATRVSTSGTLLVTADGGVTWKPYVTPLLVDLSFVDDREGWAVAVPSRRGDPYRVLHSVDGGATWTRVPSPPDP